ncbi:MAG: site-specific DNA-methyltransferase [Candidatus Saccharimonadales bacterium]
MTEDSADLHEISGKSPEFRTELAKQLEELVPEVVADGKVDVAKLKDLLAEDAGDTNERFGLFWPGKKRAMRAAQDATTATLKPAKELSKDWDTTQNIFIEGDNLEVLKVLQKQYHNSIKMIYIDPPYNTGKDFVYPDNFKEGLQNYLEFSKQVDEGNKKISTNTETTGRYHSNWLNMMYPRLKLARNLLTDDGVIFISIGSDEVGNLSKTCSEIFGEDNTEVLVWNKEAEGSSGTLKATQRLRNIHEYIVVAYRNKERTNFVKVSEPLKGKESELQTANLAVNADNEKVDHKNYFTITNPSGDNFTRQWKWGDI